VPPKRRKQPERYVPFVLDKYLKIEYIINGGKMEQKFDKCLICSSWDKDLEYYPEVCFFCNDSMNFQKREGVKLFEEFGDRVKILEEKKGMFAFGSIYKVSVKYSNGKDFFIGWVDENFMPILFGNARDKKLVSDDIAYPMENKFEFTNNQEIMFKFADRDDKDEIIDLRFQSFFDFNKGSNCISALAALKQVYDKNHFTIKAVIDNKIIGLIYGYDQYNGHLDNDEFYIEYIYVHKNFRNRNIGGLLLNYMEKVAKELGFARIKVLIQGKQEEANIPFNFNLKHGFKHDADNVYDVGNGFLSVTMEKEM
jgi:GNAT superfamily N-acetyltransferase